MRVYLASDAAKAAGASVPTLTPDLEKSIIDRLERDAALKEIAVTRKAVVTDDQVTEAFTQLLAHTSSSQSDIEKYLADNYHWTKEDFKQNVIRPSLLETEVAKTYSTSSTNDSFAAFDAEITTRLKRPDVKTYLRFSDAAEVPVQQ
jgi:FKBP-type peptidyl-prolyl cis-trans isomerase (trigger factor)